MPEKLKSKEPIVTIPTLSRIHRQLTLAALPTRWLARTWLVVPEHEANLHRYSRLLVHNVRGPAATRQFILETVDAPSVFQLDDDLRWYVRRSYHPKIRLRDAQPEDVGQCLDELVDWLRDQSVGLVAVSQRQGNCWEREAWTSVATRPCRAWGYTPSVLRDLPDFRFDQVEFLEDFNLCLWVLRSGLNTRMTWHFATGQSGSNTSGGCSGIRTRENHAAAVRQLARLHPAYVRIVQKQTVDDWFGGDGVRDDVVISWARAAQDGRNGVIEQLPLFRPTE
jgi:hypothetical protein